MSERVGLFTFYYQLKLFIDISLVPLLKGYIHIYKYYFCVSKLYTFTMFTNCKKLNI